LGDSHRETLGRYTLFASAIAGRPVEIAPGDAGTPAWTDGATIFVDAEIERRDVLRTVAVQASLLGAGSLEPEISALLVRRDQVAKRYLAIEGHRALAAHEDLLPSAARSLVDPAIATRTGSPADSLALAASREPLAAAPLIFGALRPRRLRPASDRALDKPVARDIPRRAREDLLRELEDDDERDEPVVDLGSSPIAGGGPIGRLLKRFLGDARSRGRGAPGPETPTHSTRRSIRSRGTSTLTTAAPRFETVTSVEHRGATYPEWDGLRRRYRPNWCTVVEVDARRDNRAASPPTDTRALRRPLAHLGLDLERSRRQLQGDDIDIDAAIEALVQAAAGSAPDEAVYIDSLRCRRDLAVLVLLDISGSAGESGSLGRTVHEHQRAAAAALTAAFGDLGDRVALYGFHSSGRSAVHVVPVKRFDDALDAHVFQRLGSLVPGAYTRLGAAIRHGVSVVEADGGTQRRLLVVVSDGFAYDHGYEGAYGEADARRALAEARRRGTACCCLSIGASVDAGTLRRVFGTAAHAILPRGEDLPGVVGPLFRVALQSADVQRRAWQRAERTRERLGIERRTA
jgi:nitric oxide reductase NorD protein